MHLPLYSFVHPFFMENCECLPLPSDAISTFLGFKDEQTSIVHLELNSEGRAKHIITKFSKMC
jgi:hypothetical protein